MDKKTTTDSIPSQKLQHKNSQSPLVLRTEGSITEELETGREKAVFDLDIKNI